MDHLRHAGRRRRPRRSRRGPPRARRRRRQRCPRAPWSWSRRRCRSGSRRDARARSGRRLRFACVPENLRLGRPSTRSGSRSGWWREPSTPPPVRTSCACSRPSRPRSSGCRVESAEMTKHALNAFLATSVAFTNELARVCERVGADASEVERGLKTEPRIGPKAYVSPGAAFAGGTLARDLRFLSAFGAREGVATPLVEGVLASNAAHACRAPPGGPGARRAAGRGRRRARPDVQARHRHAAALGVGRALPLPGGRRRPGARARPGGARAARGPGVRPCRSARPRRTRSLGADVAWWRPPGPSTASWRRTSSRRACAGPAWSIPPASWRRRSAPTRACSTAPPGGREAPMLEKPLAGRSRSSPAPAAASAARSPRASWSGRRRAARPPGTARRCARPPTRCARRDRGACSRCRATPRIPRPRGGGRARRGRAAAASPRSSTTPASTARSARSRTTTGPSGCRRSRSTCSGTVALLPRGRPAHAAARVRQDRQPLRRRGDRAAAALQRLRRVEGGGRALHRDARGGAGGRAST